MKKLMLTSSIIALMLVASSWAVVIVEDDFEDGVVDPLKWTLPAALLGDGAQAGAVEVGGRLEVTDATVHSIATTAPTATESVILSTSFLDPLDITGNIYHYRFGLENGAQDNQIMLHTHSLGSGPDIYMIMNKNGSTQFAPLLGPVAGWDTLEGPITITWDQNKVVVEHGWFGTWFDSSNPALNSGISWDIPTAPMGASVSGSYQADTTPEQLTDLKLEIIPEPATIALLGFGLLGVIKRRRA